MTSPQVVTLDEANFEKEVTQSDLPVLVDFWAPWCGPCRMIAPVLDEIAREKAGAVKVGKVNVDENQQLSMRFKVQYLPSMLLFKNGELHDTIVGLKSKKELLSKIETLAG